jgi:hypothetical protein
LKTAAMTAAGAAAALASAAAASGEFAQAYVIAHEVGHHVQNLMGIMDKVDQLRRNASQTQANALSVRVELQADCFAGVWAKNADKARSILENGDVESALNAATAIGDDALQGLRRYLTCQWLCCWLHTRLGNPIPDRALPPQQLPASVRQSFLMTSSFSNLSLAEPLARAVAEMGYETMTPIQEQAIPVVLQGKDVMGAAQTGTGKTAAFALPLLQRMLKHENASTSPARHPVRALVLLPTRELADQVAQQVELYAKHTNLRSAVVFGGMDMKPQTAELKRGVEVLVATPGRLLDHIEAKNAVLNQVEYVVLDEADRMLDIGFLPDLQRILSYLPKQRTTLAVLRHLLARDQAPGHQLPAGPGDHRGGALQCHRFHRRAAFLQRGRRRQAPRPAPDRLTERGITQAFVFVNSKLGCARLARSLEREGLKTTALHGDKSQDERLKGRRHAHERGHVLLRHPEPGALAAGHRRHARMVAGPRGAGEGPAQPASIIGDRGAAVLAEMRWQERQEAGAGHRRQRARLPGAAVRRHRRLQRTAGRLRAGLVASAGRRSRPKQGWRHAAALRLRGIGYILVFGFLLLVSLVVSTLLSLFSGWAGTRLPLELALRVLNEVIAFVDLRGAVRGLMRLSSGRSRRRASCCSAPAWAPSCSPSAARRWPPTCRRRGGVGLWRGRLADRAADVDLLLVGRAAAVRHRQQAQVVVAQQAAWRRRHRP